jgi:hypothetical protein
MKTKQVVAKKKIKESPKHQPTAEKWDVWVDLITNQSISLTAESNWLLDGCLEVEIITLDKNGVGGFGGFYRETPFFREYTRRHALVYRIGEEGYLEQFSASEIITQIVGTLFNVPAECIRVRLKETNVDDSDVPF